MFYSNQRKTLINELNQLKANIGKERASWKEVVDGYKDLYEKEENRKWELVSQKPFYKFILGDEITGWVWMVNCDDIPEIKIGSKIKLYEGNDRFKEVVVTSFDNAKITKHKSVTITFYVEEK